MTNKKKNVYLVDGHALCYRAYYAIQDLSTSKGVPTNAVYGFVNMLRKLLREYKPEMLTIVFDSAAPTERHKKYEDYKVTRKPMPDDLIEQIPKIKQIVEAYGISICQMEGYEADDIIATLAEKAKNSDLDVTIVTGDKDALQLVDKHIRVLSPHMGEDKLYGPDEIKDKYGVNPKLMIDLMALMGDATDNIPGVKGIGRLTAGKLISKYGSVDNIYKNIDKISPESVRNKLREGKEMAELSRELIKLDKQVPIKVDIRKIRLGKQDVDQLTELYKELEFEKFLQEIMPKKTDKGKYTIKRDIREIRGAIKEIVKHKLTALSIAEGSSGKGIKGIAFCPEQSRAYFLPMEKGGSYCEETYKLLKDVLEDKNIKKISFDAKRDMSILRQFGVELKGIAFDVMIAEYLIDPARSKYDLSGMAIRYLGYKLSTAGNNVKWDKNGQGTMELSTQEGEITQKCEESDAIMHLYGILTPVLKEKHLDSLFHNVEMPLISVLSDMESEGVNVDVKYLKEQSSVMGQALNRISKKIYQLAGEKFNINSPKQLQKILYDKLNLPAVKKTKTGLSTDESVLQKLAAVHELPKILLEYRELNKLKTGYYDSLIAMAKNSKIYARFNQAVTATGRLSSSEPNLQNIPIKTALGKEIRRAFISGDKEKLLLSADYSQIELRILAHLSKDQNLIKAFKKGEDVHKFTASLIFNCSLKDVTGEMRAAAKTVNFGIIYGMSPFGLAKDMNISLEESQRFIEAYFKRYVGIKAFIDKTIAEAEERGFVTTLLKRRRYISGITGDDRMVKGFAERAAVNTPVQGSAADLIKLAMIDCHKAFKDTDVGMIIQVHDELVFKIPKNILEETAKKIKRIMENVIELRVPLKVDIKAGTNWLDMKKVKF